MKLSGKSVLITGAAGRIGSATARLALAAGAEVFLADISGQRLSALQIELQSEYAGRIYTVEADVASEDGIDYLLTQCS